MAWGISHKYRFIYIHVPKTAGKTTCSRWEGSLLGDICKETGVITMGHKTAVELQAEYPLEFKHYFKFATVRNPYDRFVSGFFYRYWKPRESLERDWLGRNCEPLLPQLHWITDGFDGLEYGKIIVNRLLRFEYIVQELTNTFRSLGIEMNEKIPHFGKRSSDAPYQSYYDEKLKALVSYLYREDLKRLGYTWEDNGLGNKR